MVAAGLVGVIVIFVLARPNGPVDSSSESTGKPPPSENERSMGAASAAAVRDRRDQRDSVVTERPAERPEQTTLPPPAEISQLNVREALIGDAAAAPSASTPLVAAALDSARTAMRQRSFLEAR
jgi:hypothetical protein